MIILAMGFTFAMGAFSVAVLTYGNVGRFEVGDASKPSGWVHDGKLYVRYWPGEEAPSVDPYASGTFGGYLARKAKRPSEDAS